jgi:hypothetical protein
MPIESWVIGWVEAGRASSVRRTCSGSVSFARHAAVTSATWAAFGTSPVSSSQKTPSGSGCDPPEAFGSFAWSSGMVMPR